MNPARSVIVTGAAGLIGQEVCRLLLAEGHRVVATDVVDVGDSALPIVVCDLRDIDALRLVVEDGVDSIVHCGGFSGPMHGEDAPRTLIDVNVGGTANLLELARVRGIPRFVYASTATAYGMTSADIVTEDAVLRPHGVYAASKAASEDLVTAYRTQFGLDATSLRLSWVYGPRRTTTCLIRTFLIAALEGAPLHLQYGADFPRQYVHVHDAARALVSAATREGSIPQPAYNITGGDLTTLGEVADAVLMQFPDADIRLTPGPDPLDVRQGRFDITAARRDLAFDPEIALADGIHAYAEHLRATDIPS